MTLFDKICKDLKISEEDKNELSKRIKDKEDVNEIGFHIDGYFETASCIRKKTK